VIGVPVRAAKEVAKNPDHQFDLSNDMSLTHSHPNSNLGRMSSH
jgi:hypothetical protein